MLIRVLIILLLVHSAKTPASGRHKERWWRASRSRRFVTFDWNCASTKAVSQRLHARVLREIPAEDRTLPSAWGDRAVTIRLRRDRPPVLFVPVTCGGTGNCGWRLYDSKRHTFLGEIWGQFLYVVANKSSWPQVVTYGHESVCSGSLARFEFRRGQYRVIGNYYAINECIPNGTPLPIQFARARRLCDGYGG
jgi:hypothetical protein